MKRETNEPSARKSDVEARAGTSPSSLW